MGFALHLCQVMANDFHLFASDDSHGSVLVYLECVPVYYYSHLHLRGVHSQHDDYLYLFIRVWWSRGPSVR